MRHTVEGKNKIKSGVRDARKRIIEERGSYLTPEGLENMKSKLHARLTPERRKRFAKETKEALKKAEVK